MPQSIEIPGVGMADFPDDAKPEEIQQFLDDNYNNKLPRVTPGGTVARAGAESILPSVGAAAGGALAAEYVPFAHVLPPWSEIGAGLIGAVAGGVAAEKGQKALAKAVVPENLMRQYEGLRQADIEQQPVPEFLGELGGAMTTFRVSPGATLKGIRSAVNLARGVVPEAERAARMQEAVGSGIQLGFGAGQGIANPLLGGQTPTVGGVAKETLMMGLLGQARWKALGGGHIDASAERPEASPEVRADREKNILERFREKGQPAQIIDGYLPRHEDVVNTLEDGSVVISRPNLHLALEQHFDPKFKAGDVADALLSEENIHGALFKLGGGKEKAERFWNDFTSVEKNAFLKLIPNAVDRETGISKPDSYLGYEASRFLMQRALGMTPAEFLEVQRSTGMSNRSLGRLIGVVGWIRRNLGRTKASKRQGELLNKIEATLKGAINASGEQETTEIHGDVQPQQAPAEELPKQEGGPGVQPQAPGRVEEEAKVLLKPGPLKPTDVSGSPDVGIVFGEPKKRYKGEVIEESAYVADDAIHYGPYHLKALGKAAPDLAEKYAERESRNVPRFGYRTNRRPFVSRELGGLIAKKAGQDLEDFEGPAHSDQIADKTGKPISEKPDKNTPFYKLGKAPPSAPTGEAQPGQVPAGSAVQPPVAPTAGGPAAGKTISEPSPGVKLTPEQESRKAALDKVRAAIMAGKPIDAGDLGKLTERAPMSLRQDKGPATEDEIRARVSAMIPEDAFSTENLPLRQQAIDTAAKIIADARPDERETLYNEFYTKTERYRQDAAARMERMRLPTDIAGLKGHIHYFLNKEWGPVQIKARVEKERAKGYKEKFEMAAKGAVDPKQVKIRYEAPTFDRWRSEVTNPIRWQLLKREMPKEYANEDYLRMIWNESLDEFLPNASRDKLEQLRRVHNLEYGKYRGVLADPDPDPIIEKLARAKPGMPVVEFERFAAAHGYTHGDAIKALQAMADRQEAALKEAMFPPTSKTPALERDPVTEADIKKRVEAHQEGIRFIRKRTSKLIGELHRRMVATPRTMEKDPLRSTISSDDVWTENHSSEYVFREFSDAELRDQETLGQMLVDESAGTAKSTHRVTVLRNHKTGELDAVSTYRHKRSREVMLYDPDGTPEDKTGEHIRLNQALVDRTPIATILLRHPVRHFHQRWASEGEYMAELGYMAESGRRVWEDFNSEPDVDVEMDPETIPGRPAKSGMVGEGEGVHGRGPGEAEWGLLKTELHSLNRAPMTGVEADAVVNFFQKHPGTIRSIFDIEPALVALRNKPVLTGNDYCFMSAMTKAARYWMRQLMSRPEVRRDMKKTSGLGYKKFIEMRELDAWGLALNDIYESAKELKESGTSGFFGDPEAFRASALGKYGDATRRDIQKTAVQLEQSEFPGGTALRGPAGREQFVVPQARVRELHERIAPWRRVRPELRGGIATGRDIPREQPKIPMLSPEGKRRVRAEAESRYGKGGREPMSFPSPVAVKEEPRPISPGEVGRFLRETYRAQTGKEPYAPLRQPAGPEYRPSRGGQLYDPTIDIQSSKEYRYYNYMKHRMPGEPLGGAKGRIIPEGPTLAKKIDPEKLRVLLSRNLPREQLMAEIERLGSEDAPAMTLRQTGFAKRYQEELEKQGRVIIEREGEDVVTDPETLTRAEMVAEGKRTLLNGGDPAAAMEALESGKTSSGTWWKDVSLVRYIDYLLVQKVDEARKGTPEWDRANAQWNSWRERYEEAIKKEWARTGHVMQGVQHIPTGSYAESRRIAEKAKGKRLTEEEDEELDAIVDELNKASAEVEEGVSKHGEAIEKTDIEAASAETKAQVDRVAEEEAKNLKRLIEDFNRRHGRAPMAIDLGGKTPQDVDPLDWEVFVVDGSNTMLDLSRKGLLSDANWRLAMTRKYGDLIGPHLDTLQSEATKYRNRKIDETLGLHKATEPAKRKLTRRMPSIEKCKTVVSRAVHMDPTGRKISTPEAYHIWSFIKQKYLEHKTAEGVWPTFEKVVQGAASELGIPVKRVYRALTTNKTYRTVERDMYSRLERQRRTLTHARNWMYNLEYPKLLQYARRIPRWFFMDKIAGHGFVGMITHASPMMFNPWAWKAYIHGWRDMYKMGNPMEAGRVEHEKKMREIENHPHYPMWLKAKLQINPFKLADDYSVAKLNKFMEVTFGGRGFDALKTMRLEQAERMWAAQPVHLRTQAMANEIAQSVNHMTGIIQHGTWEAANWVFFAPKLALSQFAFLFKDPLRASSIFATWGKATPEQRTWAISELKQKAAIAAVYYSFLMLNRGLLKAIGSDQDVNTSDPRRTDFLQFKIAGMKLGVAGPLIGIVRTVADMLHIAAGDRSQLEKLETRQDRIGKRMWEYARGKMSPLASLTTDVMTGEDFTGRPLPWSSDQLPRHRAIRGETPYTGTEWALSQFSPIPAEEAVREVFRAGGMSEIQAGEFIRALLIGASTAATGARVSHDQFLDR